MCRKKRCFLGFSLEVVPSCLQELVFLMEVKGRSGIAVFILMGTSRTRDFSVSAIACSGFNWLVKLEANLSCKLLKWRLWQEIVGSEFRPCSCLYRKTFYLFDWGFSQFLRLEYCCISSEDASSELLLLFCLQSRKQEVWKLFSRLKMNKPVTLN